jgi:hypothetical protein
VTNATILGICGDLLGPGNNFDKEDALGWRGGAGDEGDIIDRRRGRATTMIEAQSKGKESDAQRKRLRGGDVTHDGLV